MEHLVTIAFDFDDKTVTKKIEDTVEKAVINKITAEVEEKLFERDYWNRRKVDPEKDNLSQWTECIVKEIFFGYKEEVITKAAELVADSFRRTKAWKEAAQRAIEDDA